MWLPFFTVVAITGRYFLWYVEGRDRERVEDLLWGLYRTFIFFSFSFSDFNFSSSCAGVRFRELLASFQMSFHRELENLAAFRFLQTFLFLFFERPLIFTFSNSRTKIRTFLVHGFGFWYRKLYVFYLIMYDPREEERIYFRPFFLLTFFFLFVTRLSVLVNSPRMLLSGEKEMRKNEPDYILQWWFLDLAGELVIAQLINFSDVESKYLCNAKVEDFHD